MKIISKYLPKDKSKKFKKYEEISSLDRRFRHKYLQSSGGFMGQFWECIESRPWGAVHK